MITFQEETLKQVRGEELNAILKLHVEELSKFSSKLDPDWNVYQKLEDLKALHIVTARDNKKLIGYYVSIIVKHYHYKDSIIAENDIHYILPVYRKGWIGYKFLKQVIQFLKDRNVDIILHTMKADHSYLPITKRLGFKLTDYKLTMEV